MTDIADTNDGILVEPDEDTTQELHNQLEPCYRSVPHCTCTSCNEERRIAKGLKGIALEYSLEQFYTKILKPILESFELGINNNYTQFSISGISNTCDFYQSIKLYKEKGTIFYSKFMEDNPTINIKRIGEIRYGENLDIDSSSRRATKLGTYYVFCTVYFEKRKTIKK